MLPADQRRKQKHEDVLLPAHPQEFLLIGERKWTDVEPEDYSPVDDQVSKQLSTLLRHGHLLREDDGAIEVWRKKNIFGTILCDLHMGLMKSGSVQWQEAEETRKDFNIVLIRQDKKFLSPSSSRSFRTQFH